MSNLVFSFEFHGNEANTEENDSEIVDKRTILYVDSVFFHYLARELALSPIFGAALAHNLKSSKFLFILVPTSRNLIDYKWNERVTEMVRERAELDHALSWLSTLGGAFSALGDYFANCAEIAGKISFNQLKLAFRLNDPQIAARCRLYFSLSLIQQRQFSAARRIISNEYHSAVNCVVVDEKLVKMCKGIWSKLQYEHKMYKKSKAKLNNLL